MGMRLNVGCGPDLREGWWNGDLRPVEGAEHFDASYASDWCRFGNETAQEISLRHVLEHLNARGIEVAMRHSYRVLEPGGTLTVEVPFYRCFDQITDPSHVTPFELRTWGHLLRHAPGYELDLRLEVSPEPILVGRAEFGHMPEWAWRSSLVVSGVLSRVLTKLVVGLGLRFVQEWVPRGVRVQWTAVFSKP